MSLPNDIIKLLKADGYFINENVHEKIDDLVDAVEAATNEHEELGGDDDEEEAAEDD